MDKLKLKILVSELVLFIILGLLIFVPSWTVFYWQGWIYLLFFAISMLVMTLYFLKHDRALMERRVNIGPKAEKKIIQKILLSCLIIFMIGLFLLSSFDYRFHLSKISVFVVLFSNLLILAGFYIFFRVFKENSFASATIDLSKEQKVISTGPYSVVRHPMYSGALIICLFTPFALGSLLGICLSVLIAVIIVFRIMDEEKFLKSNLAGYTDYCKKTRYRLIPYVW